MESVTSVETVLQPWRPNSSHHKKLWKKLYSQNAQQSNVKTLFKTTVANNSTVKYFLTLEKLSRKNEVLRVGCSADFGQTSSILDELSR